MIQIACFNVLEGITAIMSKVIEADPDDNKFVDCAVTAKALCIVTNDKHFGHLSKYEFPYVEILKLKDAVAMLFSTKGLA